MTSSIINALAFPSPERAEWRLASLRRRQNLMWFTTSTGEKIPALLVKQQNALFTSSRKRRFLVMYSHGNAEDLAQLPSLVEDMARTLRCDVLAYEYIGYSIADGSPSEAGCYASAMAAYEWALTKYAPNDIIPFGRSLGSAPACYIASQATQPVGGLILQSPLLSGANALLGSVVAFGFFFLDILKNYNHILNARCRVAITHGTADGVVPCWNVRAHSLRLFFSLALPAHGARVRLSLTHRAASSTLSPPTRS